MKVVAVGVIALLIILGFAAYVGCYGIQFLTGDVSMKDLGVGMIVAGIIIYLIEIIAYYIFRSQS